MVYGRTRSRVSPLESGTRTYWKGGPVTTVYHPQSVSTCIDIVGNYPNPNPLEITHRRWGKVGTFTRPPQPWVVYSFSNYPFDNQGINGVHPVSPSIPSVTATITETQARTNPSRPEVSVPGFLGELRDIPGMLHLKGNAHAKSRSSSSAVAYNFGWGALISDLLKLADFTEQVDKRLRELEALHSKRGLRRKWTPFDESYAGSSSTAFQTAWSQYISGFTDYVHRTRRWGSVQWVPSVPFFGTNGDLAALARRTVHGWGIDGGTISATMWNLLPWSWFADYFFNLGDYLDSQRNSVGAIAQIGCVMTLRSTTWKQRIVSVSSPEISVTPGYFTFEQKFRVLASAGLSATVPFLSGGQLVTLASIAQSLGQR